MTLRRKWNSSSSERLRLKEGVLFIEADQHFSMTFSVVRPHERFIGDFGQTENSNAAIKRLIQRFAERLRHLRVKPKKPHASGTSLGAAVLGHLSSGSDTTDLIASVLGEP
jgi:hypothetical protein